MESAIWAQSAKKKLFYGTRPFATTMFLIHSYQTTVVKREMKEKKKKDSEGDGKLPHTIIYIIH
ncbi:CLUMA_CG001653, isoform A [Clunio marinus]|uniref:CLUMA_CG001653, isoform A n=1 Tax=Clunio marinus TaxID=568069 RepID=A0A1J1HJZ2_9DIPT|nr:CLUMA_CG001653, isoform A [Clunio marinus]